MSHFSLITRKVKWRICNRQYLKRISSTLCHPLCSSIKNKNFNHTPIVCQQPLLTKTILTWFNRALHSESFFYFGYILAWHLVVVIWHWNSLFLVHYIVAGFSLHILFIPKISRIIMELKYSSYCISVKLWNIWKWSHVPIQSSKRKFDTLLLSLYDLITQ